MKLSLCKTLGFILETQLELNLGELLAMFKDGMKTNEEPKFDDLTQVSDHKLLF